MALSKPSLGIQSPILCQLCERDPKISWKCLECDLLMCSGCKNNIHPKIKTAGEHKIIAIKDIGTSPNNVPLRVDITLVETYQTKLEEVCVLAISLDGLLWISDGHSKKRIRLFSSHTGLQKVKCEGNNLKVISNFNTVVYGMAVTPDNDLLIITDASTLKQIKSGTNKIVNAVYNLDPFEPVSIHVTKKYKVIVGATMGRGKGMVIVMDHEGNREKVDGEGHTKRVSMYYPSKITATSDDNIFVMNHIFEGKKGKTVIVLKHEDIINTYSGQSSINTEDKPFTPYDLITTPTDNVIVLDSEEALHILNSSGQPISYINTKDKGIHALPYSIGLAMEDNSCMVYIGTPQHKSNDAKIFKMNLIGC